MPAATVCGLCNQRVNFNFGERGQPFKWNFPTPDFKGVGEWVQGYQPAESSQTTVAAAVSIGDDVDKELSIPLERFWEQSSAFGNSETKPET